MSYIFPTNLVRGWDNKIDKHWYADDYGIFETVWATADEEWKYPSPALRIEIRAERNTTILGIYFKTTYQSARCHSSINYPLSEIRENIVKLLSVFKDHVGVWGNENKSKQPCKSAMYEGKFVGYIESIDESVISDVSSTRNKDLVPRLKKSIAKLIGRNA